MENYICIDGKKAELTEEQLKTLGIKLKKKSIFDKAKYAKEYYFINNFGEIDCFTENDCSGDRLLYNIANYCTDKEQLKQRALHETLNRLLFRFSMENGGEEIDWNNKIQYKYFIELDYGNNKWRVEFYSRHKSNNEYFISREVAQRAINEIIKPFMKENPDFVW